MPKRHAYCQVLAAALALLSVTPGARAAEMNSAEVIAHTIPAAADMGTIAAVELTVKNTGNDAWTADRKVSLTINDAGSDKNWGVTRVDLESTDAIEPSDNKTFHFDLHIPDTPGNYTLSWALMLDGREIPATGASAVAVRVDDPVARAGFVSQLLPDRVAPGEHFKALVQFRNDGRTSWSRAKGVRLAAADEATAKSWTISQVDFDSDDETIRPGAIATFAFLVKAPDKPGEYDMNWRMYQDGRRYFGEPGPTTAITVGGGNNPGHAHSGALSAEFVGQTTPARVAPNQLFRVAVIFKNTGDQAWKPGSVVLTAQPPANNLVWLVDEIELTGARPVAPGDIKAFEFTVRAPSEPGDYPFVWRLYHTATGGFGDHSELRQISVTK